MPKAVLDTNILVSAFITPRGTPAKLLQAWRTEHFDLVTSPPILEELQDALCRHKLTRRYHLSLDDIRNFVTLLARLSIVVPGTTTVSAAIPDPDDLMVLATAIESQAAYLVTGDRALLALERFQSMQLITPVSFLRIIVP